MAPTPTTLQPRARTTTRSMPTVTSSSRAPISSAAVQTRRWWPASMLGQLLTRRRWPALRLVLTKGELPQRGRGEHPAQPGKLRTPAQRSSGLSTRAGSGHRARRRASCPPRRSSSREMRRRARTRSAGSETRGSSGWAKLRGLRGQRERRSLGRRSGTTHSGRWATRCYSCVCKPFAAPALAAPCCLQALAAPALASPLLRLARAHAHPFHTAVLSAKTRAALASHLQLIARSLG
jgi:hypothetical protein